MQTEAYLGLKISFDENTSYEAYLSKKDEIEKLFKPLTQKMEKHPTSSLRAHLVRIDEARFFTFAAIGTKVYLGIYENKQIKTTCTLAEIALLNISNRSILADRVSTFIMNIDNDNYRYKSLENAWINTLESAKQIDKEEEVERE